MPSAVEVELADLIASQLNTQSFSLQFRAVRQWRPRFKPGAGELDIVQVTVVPAALSIFLDTRATSSHTYLQAVGVQKKLGSESASGKIETEIDGLAYFNQEVRDYLAHQTLTLDDGSMCSYAGADAEPIIDPDHLEQEHIFTALNTFRYLIDR